MQKNYYLILGLTRTASTEEIKRAFRLLAKKYHPDKNNGNRTAEEQFKEIQEAYQVLSNPEKRRAYDQRFFQFSSRPGQPGRGQQSYGQYTGNAYQYAQQQANYKKQQQSQQFNKRTAAPEQPDKSENYSILISVAVAVVLLYSIIYYSNSRKAEVPKHTEQMITPTMIRQLLDSINAPAETTEIRPQISEYASPYSAVFGEEESDETSKNSLTLHNVANLEAVICLVENLAPNKTIRNQYMTPGSTFKMNHIPNGDYYLKVYFGNDWDSTKVFVNSNARGGFKNDFGFLTMNTGKNVIRMRQTEVGSSTSFSSFEISLNPIGTKGISEIHAAEFFGKN